MNEKKPKWRGNSFQSLSDWAKMQKPLSEQKLTKPGAEPKGIQKQGRERLNRNFNHNR